MTAELPLLPDAEQNRFPLSFVQEMWCMLDQGDDAGAFGPRFVTSRALRITGPVDTTALQAALDDLVARHEILRSVVVRDADPPYQQVHPPRPVSLRVVDLRHDRGDRSKDDVAMDLILEQERGSIDVREVPLLRAVLGRLDERDWVFVLLIHHSASDGWSSQVILRDLAACYAARMSGRAATLPAVRQYREFAAWQQDRVAGPAAARMLDYWRDKLADAQIFALPADRTVPERHSRPYSAYNFSVSAPVITAAADLAKATRGSAFMVLLAAFDVLAHEITGTTDPVIDTLMTGRNQPAFQDTVGPFVNFMPLRTELGGCATFGDVLLRTRQTCLGAYAHEIPIEHLKRHLPELMRPNTEPMNIDSIFGMFQAQFVSDELQISEGSSEINERGSGQESPELPRGLAWTMTMLPSGDLAGSVQYNTEEVDTETVVGWVSSYSRILAAAVSDPESAWRTL